MEISKMQPKPVEVSLEEYEMMMAMYVGGRRHVESKMSGRENAHGADLLKRGEWDVSIEGAAGEIAVAKVLGHYWDGSVNRFGQGGDVGSYEVKTTDHENYDLMVRPNVPDHVTVVFVIGRSPHFKIMGYIKAGDAQRDDWLHDYKNNRPDAYMVPREELHDISSLLVAPVDIEMEDFEGYREEGNGRIASTVDQLTGVDF